jgi:hypothetical protein
MIESTHAEHLLSYHSRELQKKWCGVIVYSEPSLVDYPLSLSIPPQVNCTGSDF